MTSGDFTVSIRITFTLILALLAAGVVIWLGGWPTTYLNFKSLTVDEVTLDAERYVEQYFGSGSACIYEVRCDTGRALLYIVEDVDAWDIQQTKSVVWERRFSEECPGRTANIGLHVLPDTDQTYSDSTALAIWSFRGDRFIPTLSRYSGGAFSEQGWQRCTSEYALAFSGFSE